MSKIQSYEDLLKAELALQESLAHQRAEIRMEVTRIKEQLKPLTKVISFVSKFVTRHNGNNALVTTGIGIASDILFKNVVLKKSGWLTRLVLPFVMKNYSSHALANGNLFGRLGEKIKDLVKKRPAGSSAT